MNAQATIHQEMFTTIQDAWKRGQTVTFLTRLRVVSVSADVARKFEDRGRPIIKLTQSCLALLQGRRYVTIATGSFLFVGVNIT